LSVTDYCLVKGGLYMRVATTLIIGLALSLCAFTVREVRAEIATQEEMELVCQNWLAYMVHETGGWAGEPHPQIIAVDDIFFGDTVLARCYSIAPNGYVVVPILKELPPIKAYSEKCNLNVDQTVGFPQLLWDVLLHRIKLYLKAYGSLDAKQPAFGEVLFGRINRQEWDRFLLNTKSFEANLHGGSFAPLAEVGPLLTTSWHQRGPYWNFCPFGDGDSCLVGCVATAAAQIMRYFVWPPSGVGTHTYWWDGDQSCEGSTPGQNLTANFSDPYDWDNIPDSCDTGCSPEEEDALAELCYEVGVAFEMDYGACHSGASTSYAQTVFPTFFRYDVCIDREDRDEHTANSWFNLIKEEINAGRPMQYRIIGHSIVCDGWRETGGENQYHINYGWGGPHTVWFAIDHIYGSSDPMEEYLIRKIIPKTVGVHPWSMFRHDLQHTGRSPYRGPASPALKWNCTTGGQVNSSPAVGSDGTIYVGSSAGFYALNPDGSLKWSNVMGSGAYSSPTLDDDGTIYVGSWDNKLYAIDSTGSIKWCYNTGSNVSSSPAVGADGTIYVGSDGFYAINPDSSLKWRYSTGCWVGSSPAVGADGTIYVGADNGKLYAIEDKGGSGSIKWSFNTGQYVHSSPAIGSDGTIYVGSHTGRLYALHPDGSLEWSYKTGDVIDSSPAIGFDGTIYVGSQDKKLYAINPDGTLKWSYVTGHWVDSSPAVGGDGTIYVGSYDNDLYAINSNGSLKWRYTTGDHINSSPAVGTDGTIYVGSKDHKLYAIGPEIDVTLTPDATTVEQGEKLYYTVEVTNYTGADKTLEYWSNVYLWTGEPYKKNPVFGPRAGILPAGKTKSAYISHKVPNSAPLKIYTLCGRIGLHPDDLWDEDCFEFTVQKQYPNIRLTDNSANSENPAIVTDVNGNSHIAWQDDRDGNREIYFCKIDRSGNKIISDINVSETTGSSIKPDIGIDDNHNSYIVWLEGDDIYGAKLDVDGNKVSEKVVSDGIDCNNPSISTRGDGTSSVAWEERRSVFICYMIHAELNSDLEKTFEEEVNGTDILCEKEKEADIVHDPDGNCIITWLDVNNWEYAIYYGGCGYSITPFYSSDKAQHPSSCFRGPYLIVFQEYRAVEDSIVWADALDAPIGAGQDPEMDTQPNERSYVVWWNDIIENEQINDEIFLVEVDVWGNILGDEIRITNNPESSQKPTISVPNDGEWYVVWQDDRDGNWEIYYSYQY
jgi:outer membrane protein assembly factor BamB